jgi:hypothetical protein
MAVHSVIRTHRATEVYVRRQLLEEQVRSLPREKMVDSVHTAITFIEPDVHVGQRLSSFCLPFSDMAG